MILFFSFQYLNAQTPAPVYKFTDGILHNLSVERRNDRAAWELSFIGEYSKDLAFWDKDEDRAAEFTQAEFEHFATFKPVDAKRFIAKKARTEQIIILNEAHHQPYHRVFTTSLLAMLYQEGFRYLGIEAIWDWDKELNARKYAVAGTGYYLKEPCFGNLLREALKIGFTVFSYETTSRRASPDSAGINLREIDQARNIKKVLEKDPNARPFQCEKNTHTFSLFGYGLLR